MKRKRQLKLNKKFLKVFPTMKKIIKLPKKKRQEYIVNKASSSEINGMCECVANGLYGNIPLSSRQKNKLKMYKPIIKRLANKSESVKKRRELLSSQQGGFVLSSILGSAIPAIGMLIADQLKKK